MHERRGGTAAKITSKESFIFISLKLFVQERRQTAGGFTVVMLMYQVRLFYVYLGVLFILD